jgi:hypothetical protein
VCAHRNAVCVTDVCARSCARSCELSRCAHACECACIEMIHSVSRCCARCALTLQQAGYRRNLYHNSEHAADVTQSVNVFLTTGGYVRVCCVV